MPDGSLDLSEGRLRLIISRSLPLPVNSKMLGQVLQTCPKG
jgi:hypothetical protein